MGEKKHYHGHRQRLKARFLKAGPEALADYELLELLLFMGVPRRDVKPMAKALIEKFGNFAEVVSAPPERLREVDGVGESAIVAIKLAQASAIRTAQERLHNRPLLNSMDYLLSYFRTSMAYQKKEQFRVLFLDHKNYLIADEMQQEGTVNFTPVFPREIMKRALELSASAIIIVHNHPSGDPMPSREDQDMTRQIIEAAEKLDITVHDHIIITSQKHVSFRATGLMDKNRLG